jgi:hypothetical protein
VVIDGQIGPYGVRLHSAVLGTSCATRELALRPSDESGGEESDSVHGRRGKTAYITIVSVFRHRDPLRLADDRVGREECAD